MGGYKKKRDSMKNIVVRFGLSTLVILMVGLVGSIYTPSVHIEPETSHVVFKIGPSTAEASSIVNFTANGVNDNLVVQQALNALPASGGELDFLNGTYNFAGTVSRAINNVIIKGMGGGTIFNFNGVNALFSAGAQSGWQFRDLRTDAGGITVTAASNWSEQNVTIGATYYAFRTPNDNGITWTIPTGRTAYYSIAASNAPAIERAQADIVLTGVAAADTTAINSAMTAANVAGAGIVHLSSGTFQLADNNPTSLRVPSNVTLEGEGTTTVLNKAATGLLRSAIDTTGSLGFVGTPTLDIPLKAATVTLNAGQGANFAAGDLVIITSTQTFRGIAGTNKFEMMVLDAVAGDVLTFSNQTQDSYALLSTARVTKVNSTQNPVIRNLRIVGPDDNTNGDGIILTYSRNAVIDNVHVFGFAQEGIAVAGYNYNTKVTGGSIENVTVAFSGAGIETFNGNQYVLVDGVYFNNNFYSTHHGGANVNVNRFISYRDNNIVGKAGGYIFNSSQSTESVSYVGNVVDANNSILLNAGNNFLFTNNTVRGANTIMVSNASIGTVNMTGNTFYDVNSSWIYYIANNTAASIVFNNNIVRTIQGSNLAGFTLQGNIDSFEAVGNDLEWARDGQPMLIYGPLAGASTFNFSSNKVTISGTTSGAVLLQSNGTALKQCNVSNNVFSGVTGSIVDVWADNGNIDSVTINGNTSKDFTGTPAIHGRTTGANTTSYVSVTGNNLYNSGAAVTDGVKTEGNSDFWIVETNILKGFTNPLTLAGAGNVSGNNLP